jgi:hypothetical protein
MTDSASTKLFRALQPEGWVLNAEGQPRKASDAEVSEWVRKTMREEGRWQLSQMVGNMLVSTCFCPFNPEGKWFETMVFASEEDGGDELFQARCGSWLEAVSQHESAVETFGGEVLGSPTSNAKGTN